MHTSKFILVLVLLGFARFAPAQDTELRQRLYQKKNLTEIMQIVREYYREPETMQRMSEEERRRSLKHWQRWEWFMSSRLSDEGNLINIGKKMMEATGLERQSGLESKGSLTTLSSAGNWSLVGPTNTTSGIGRIDRLAFHPTDADVVFAGSTAGGLWRTTNGGTSWSSLTPNISSPAISGIAINPVNPSVMYILTGDGDSNIGGLVDDFGYMRLSIGVLKSTNGGATWQKTGEFPGADYSTLVGYRLVMHPTNPDILYACTSQGLFGSINGGDSWGLLNGAGRFYNLKFQPGSDNVCYAVGRSAGGSRAYFWRSTSSGLFNSWDSTNTINNQINNPTSRVELAVASSNASVVYLLCGGVPGNGSFKGLYRSTNAGVSFSLQSNSPNILGRASDGSDNAQQSNYDLALAVSNTTSATVITGGVRCWRSLNSGLPGSWDYRGSHHEDVHELGFHPVDNKLWMANDGGVYSSTDNGATWTSHFSTMSTSQFYRLAVRPDDIQQIIAGAQDNGLKRRPANTATFDHVSGADGFTVGYDAINTSIFYVIRNQDVFRYTNDGASIGTITPNAPGSANNPFAMSMAPHTTLGNALFVGSDSVWRTTDGGNNWSFSLVNAGWFLRTCPSNGSRVYAAGGTSFRSSAGILRRSDDGGVTWPAGNILSNNPGFPGTYPKITSINVDPTNSLRVWVTFGGFTAGVKVYYSADGGENWVSRSGTLPNVPVNCVVLDNSNNAYIGTDNGVYYRGTSMSDWVPFYNNLPYVPVTDLAISQADNRIRAATFGRGIWSSDLYSPCVPDLVLAGTLTGRDFFEASNSVSTTNVLQLAEGTNVQMRGGTEVRLMPGFTAYETTQFRAVTGPCGSGGVAAFTSASDGTSPMTQLSSSSGKKKAFLHVKPGSSRPSLVITTLEAGDIEFLLTDAQGVVIRHWEKEQYMPGVVEKSLETTAADPAWPPGLYYLQLLHNGVWQHMQEWELK